MQARGAQHNPNPSTTNRGISTTKVDPMDPTIRSTASSAKTSAPGTKLRVIEVIPLDRRVCTVDSNGTRDVSLQQWATGRFRATVESVMFMEEPASVEAGASNLPQGPRREKTTMRNRPTSVMNGSGLDYPHCVLNRGPFMLTFASVLVPLTLASRPSRRRLGDVKRKKIKHSSLLHGYCTWDGLVSGHHCGARDRFVLRLVGCAHHYHYSTPFLLGVFASILCQWGESSGIGRVLVASGGTNRTACHVGTET